MAMDETATLAVTYDGKSETLYPTTRSAHGHVDPEARPWRAEMLVQQNSSGAYIGQLAGWVDIPVSVASSITLGDATSTGNTGPAATVRVLSVTDLNGTRTYALPTASRLDIHAHELNGDGNAAGYCYAPLAVGSLTAFTYTP